MWFLKKYDLPRGGSLKVSSTFSRRFFRSFVCLAPKRRLFVPALTFANITVQYNYLVYSVYARFRIFTLASNAFSRGGGLKQNTLLRARRAWRVFFRLLSSGYAKARIDRFQTLIIAERQRRERGILINIAGRIWKCDAWKCAHEMFLTQSPSSKVIVTLTAISLYSGYTMWSCWMLCAHSISIRVHFCRVYMCAAYILIPSPSILVCVNACARCRESSI